MATENTVQLNENNTLLYAEIVIKLDEGDRINWTYRLLILLLYYYSQCNNCVNSEI